MQRSKLIIHVDDDPDDRFLMSETLPDGYELCSLGSGRALLEHLSHFHKEAFPLLILLDINMPEMDGWETLQRVRSQELYDSIKIIMFTTASKGLLRAEMERLRVGVVTKPFNYSGLHACWQQILSHALSPRVV